MKNNNKIENRYGYSRRQRILAWAALIGIFVCGMMAGAFVWQTKLTHTADFGVQTETDACQVREKILLQQIKDEEAQGYWHAYEPYEYNARIYEILQTDGCRQNIEMFKNLQMEKQNLANTLRKLEMDNNPVPCVIIEKTLLSNVHDCGVGYTSDCHLNNAEVYSKMAEDGCPENAENYKRMALNELKIAEGVRINEADVDRGEIRATVNTYKKLQMQNEAKKYLNKVEKLVNPGIDFIMELQRVIEE